MDQLSLLVCHSFSTSCLLVCIGCCMSLSVRLTRSTACRPSWRILGSSSRSISPISFSVSILQEDESDFLMNSLFFERLPTCNRHVGKGNNRDVVMAYL